MPHKHRRRRDEDGDAFNLEPDSIARPLAVRRVVDASTTKPIRKASSRKRGPAGLEDDTPKAFVRLMQFSRTGKGLKGLDDGNSRAAKGKKRKREDQSDANAPVAVDAAVQPTGSNDLKPNLTILPGERLKDFSARVDQALPVAGLATKGKKTQIKGLESEGRRTRHEKRLRKMQAAWREEDARIKEREAEARELEEEDDDERDAMYGTQSTEMKTSASGKKKARGKDDDDPWAELRKRREAPKGLHDVAQAPPTFAKIPKEKFKVRNGARADVADIPNAAGSLRRREELGQTRKSIIEGYRKMMGEKRSRA